MSAHHALSTVLLPGDPRPVGQIEQEIFDELDFHLEMLTRENVASGMSAEAARDAALAKFGDFSKVQSQCRAILLGDRIMWQRFQAVVSVVLLAAVVFLAVQLYSTQRANQAALAEISSSLKHLSANEPNAGSAALEASAANGRQDAWRADRPMLVESLPRNGATDVDPALSEVRVTFNKPMTDRSWSWVQASSTTFPEGAGEIHYLEDHRTCVMPVKLLPGKKYVIWLNTERFQNFIDEDGLPAEPYLLRFTTRN